MKRVMDLVGAVMGLVVLSPLFLLVALAIKIDSRGPVFFRAWRAGRKLKPFRMVKFRTMIVEDRKGGAITAPGDARITRLGAWLRLFKIDELPQLWNVLRGEMSLVGPRPEAVEIVSRYYTDEQKRIQDLQPGMTGIGQVTFFPDMTYEVPDGVDPDKFYLHDQMPRKLAVDLVYIEKQSVLYDLWIMARTVYCILVKSWWLILFRPPKELIKPYEGEVLHR